MVAGLGIANAGGRRGGAPPGGCAEPDGGRSREGVLGREPGRVGSWRNGGIYTYPTTITTKFYKGSRTSSYKLVRIGAPSVLLGR